MNGSHPLTNETERTDQGITETPRRWFILIATALFLFTQDFHYHLPDVHATSNVVRSHQIDLSQSVTLHRVLVSFVWRYADRVTSRMSLV